MNSKRNDDNSESAGGRDDVSTTPEKAASESVISVDNLKALEETKEL